ncbi:MAG: rhodanese-like domain-containing protein [Rhizomicrobium sp.]
MADAGPNYAGDVSASQAWALLKDHPHAQLVDVRTAAEWTFVGEPDLSSLGRKPVRAEWQVYPAMSRNPDFVAAVSEKLGALGASRDRPILCLCRSGGRSRAAAIALTQAGFAQAFNVGGGFEGDPDAAGHRGSANGWKAAGLPWRQT